MSRPVTDSHKAALWRVAAAVEGLSPVLAAELRDLLGALDAATTCQSCGCSSLGYDFAFGWGLCPHCMELERQADEAEMRSVARGHQ